MALEYYVRSGGKRLRCGYTTGTCAALAAAGAASLLLRGVIPDTLSLRTPAGITVEVEPVKWEAIDGAARCAVRKDAGDDPDVTDGCLVIAEVRKFPSDAAVSGTIRIDGGQGVGRVTKPGLDQSVGAAAINSTPRRMIAEAVESVRAAAGYEGGLSVVISVLGGERIAERTFNPALGVAGGISILGTTGIVEPMSDRAVVDTLAVQLRQAALSGETRLILTPGNYGMDFLRRTGLSALGIPCIRCSNFIGDALDLAAEAGFQSILLVGHLGKLVKLAGNIFNTHSQWADCRMELLCAHAAVCGADAALCRALLDAAATDACIALLDHAGLRDAVLSSLLTAVQRNLDRRTGAAVQAGALVFSNLYGFLGATETAKTLLSNWGGNLGNLVQTPMYQGER
ncbi:MAG: cobalamin biosynthesis protein CbiD [Oscillibacter sp.]|nr:cobalamin biosynthesis protein CbiD [Oscillibacter sp.]